MAEPQKSNPRLAPPSAPRVLGPNSQAGLASYRGRGVPMPIVSPSPGEPGSPYNPVVRERKRDLPVAGPDTIRAMPAHLRPQPGMGSLQPQEQEQQEEQSVAGAAVKGFGSGFVGGMQAGVGDPMIDRLGRQQQILSMMREDVALTREASEAVPEADRGSWQSMLQRDERAADRMELATNDYERDLVVQGKVPAREGLPTREHDLSRFGPEQMVAPASTPAAQLSSPAPGVQSPWAPPVQDAARPAPGAEVGERMRRFPELRNPGAGQLPPQNDGPQMG